MSNRNKLEFISACIVYDGEPKKAVIINRGDVIEFNYNQQTLIGKIVSFHIDHLDNESIQVTEVKIKDAPTSKVINSVRLYPGYTQNFVKLSHETIPIKINFTTIEPINKLNIRENVPDYQIGLYIYQAELVKSRGKNIILTLYHKIDFQYKSYILTGTIKRFYTDMLGNQSILVKDVRQKNTENRAKTYEWVRLYPEEVSQYVIPRLMKIPVKINFNSIITDQETLPAPLFAPGNGAGADLNLNRNNVNVLLHNGTKLSVPKIVNEIMTQRGYKLIGLILNSNNQTNYYHYTNDIGVIVYLNQTNIYSGNQSSNKIYINVPGYQLFNTYDINMIPFFQKDNPQEKNLSTTNLQAMISVNHDKIVTILNNVMTEMSFIYSGNHLHSLPPAYIYHKIGNTEDKMNITYVGDTFYVVNVDMETQIPYFRPFLKIKARDVVPNSDENNSGNENFHNAQQGEGEEEGEEPIINLSEFTLSNVNPKRPSDYPFEGGSRKLKSPKSFTKKRTKSSTKKRKDSKK